MCHKCSQSSDGICYFSSKALQQAQVDCLSQKGFVDLKVIANIYLGPILPFFPWASRSAGCSTEVLRSNCVMSAQHRLQNQALNVLGWCNQFNFSHMYHWGTLKNYVHVIQADSPCNSIKHCIIYSCMYFWHLWIAYLLLNLKCWFFKTHIRKV